MSSYQQQQQGKRPRTEEPSSEQRVAQVQTGNIGTVLASAVSLASPNIQDHDLIGSVPAPVSAPVVEGSGNPTLYETLQVITNFLTHHRLVVAASSATMTAGRDTPITVTVTAAPYYLRTLEEFALAQLDRQAAGLRTNINRETAAGATQLVEAHTQALNAACNSDMTILLSKEKLCTIHAMQCPSDDRSGRYRTTQARAGNTLFCPSNEIDREMNHLFHSIQEYLRNWNLLLEPNNHNGNDSVSRVYHAIALTAMVLYGINDIHPFADGNGRIARIYANFMLRELLHLPFTITLVATLQQRREYIDGLQHARASVRRLASDSNDVGNTSTTPASTAAAFEPLIRMLVERVAHAIVQVQAVLAERARAALDEEEARIARRVRERAAAGQCVICLDARPNIATLCCGQAVHLNCIAEWLANGTTCVGCRSPLPRMIQPAPATQAEQPAAAPNNPPPAHDTTTTEEEDTTNNLPPNHDTTTSSAEEDTTNNLPPPADDTTTNAEEDTTNNLPPPADDTTTDAEEDTTTNLPPPADDTTTNDVEDTTTNLPPADDTTSSAEEDTTDQPPAHDGTSTAEESMTTNLPPAPQAINQTSYCLQCGRNRSALDCVLGNCGPCCVLSGVYCPRHNM
jgi:fido (protein-threonine AMPylation protein)